MDQCCNFMRCQKSADENYRRQHPPEAIASLPAPLKSNRKSATYTTQPEPEVISLSHLVASLRHVQPPCDGSSRVMTSAADVDVISYRPVYSGGGVGIDDVTAVAAGGRRNSGEVKH